MFIPNGWLTAKHSSRAPGCKYINMKFVLICYTAIFNDIFWPNINNPNPTRVSLSTDIWK